METTVVDFTSVADILLQYGVVVVSVVITGAIAWVSKKLKDKFGLEIEGRHRETLQDALEYGMTFSVNKLRELYGTKLTIDMKNTMVAFAAAYVIQQVPDTLKSFGIDPSTAEGKAKIADMVSARLNPYMFDEPDVVEFGEPDVETVKEEATDNVGDAS
jgi:hypothetical protein